ncbi:MAG: FAD synthase [Candidatus Poseidoniia archaeon]|nr:FAD synthase [Candidatus Poseidoniia archaeon]
MSVKVVATGVFDIIHIGHAHFLNAAKEHGDHLTVIVANDATVRKMKGEPILSDQRRSEVVLQLKPVDEVVIGRTGDMLDIIVEDIKPDVIALGFDQRLFTRKELEVKLLERGLQVKVVRLKEMEQDLAGSRKIISKILKIYRKKYSSE